MRYMYLVKSACSGPPPQRLMEEIGKLAEREMKAGTVVDMGGLMPLAMGARVRLAGGKVDVIDGPFAEAKEVVGGYWLIQAASKEEAVEWAKRVPAAPGSKIEIRRVPEEDEVPQDSTVQR